MVTKERRVKCFECSILKYKNEHIKFPIIDNKKYYICSEDCWKKYTTKWKSNLI